jgi:hypothetical protein
MSSLSALFGPSGTLAAAGLAASCTGQAAGHPPDKSRGPSSPPRPNNAQTCGKVERLHQTQKKWLTTQPRARTTATLQRQLDLNWDPSRDHQPQAPE